MNSISRNDVFATAFLLLTCSAVAAQEPTASPALDTNSDEIEEITVIGIFDEPAP